MKTVLIDPGSLERVSLEIVGDTYRHLFRASRLAVGDSLRLIDGEGHARRGTIREVSGHSATIALGEAMADGEPRQVVEVWVPMPRPSRASWMVEKLVEVGVSTVCFYSSKRAPRASGQRQIERLVRVAASALMQSGRSRRPVLRGGFSWDELLENVAKMPSRLVLDPAAASHTPAVSDTASPVTLVVGPEGGWTPEEAAALRSAGCHGWRLGPTVLRVETAAIIGVSRLVASSESETPAGPAA